jgi:glutathione S-transferase
MAAPVLGAMLTRRFRFDRNRADGIYESLEAQLLPIARRIERDGFLVGHRFGAADITLASLLRPLRIVPYFSRHTGLHSLFAWQRRLMREHSREDTFPYEDLIDVHRRRVCSMRSRVRWMKDFTPPASPVDIEPPALEAARNDIQPVNRWTLLLALPAYFRLRTCGGVARSPYPPVV